CGCRRAAGADGAGQEGFARTAHLHPARGDWAGRDRQGHRAGQGPRLPARQAPASGLIGSPAVLSTGSGSSAAQISAAPIQSDISVMHWITLFVVIILLAASAFFALSETALTGASRASM